MMVAKQVADSLTLLRGLIALFLAWLGITQGTEALPLAVWLLLVSWASDALDGPLSRRSQRRTWIGDHDLHFDMIVAAGLLLYLGWTGLMPLEVAGLYVLFWAIVFWRWTFVRSLGMLVQAPVYGWFIWTAVRDVPDQGRWLLIYIAAIIIVTWPRFPQHVIPEFLQGMQAVLQRVHNGQE